MSSPGSAGSGYRAVGGKQGNTPRGVGMDKTHSNGSSTNIPVGHHHERGAFMTLSRDDSELGGVTDSEMGSDFLYTVQIPATPDNQMMSATPSNRSVDPAIAGKAEQQFVSSTIFTGGFRSVTRGHVMEKMMESDGANPHLGAARGPTCAMEGCDTKTMRDERGDDLFPCDCNFRICRDCYIDALNTKGNCPGCKDEYKSPDDLITLKMEDPRVPENLRALPPPMSESDDSSKLDRRLSVTKLQISNGTNDFDHARYLYQTKGTYGYGNAVWPADDGYDSAGGGKARDSGEAKKAPVFDDKTRRPLSRKVSVSAGILSPYRSPIDSLIMPKLIFQLHLRFARQSVCLTVRSFCLVIFCEYHICIESCRVRFCVSAFRWEYLHIAFNWVVGGGVSIGLLSLIWMRIVVQVVGVYSDGGAGILPHVACPEPKHGRHLALGHVGGV